MAQSSHEINALILAISRTLRNPHLHPELSQQEPTNDQSDATTATFIPQPRGLPIWQTTFATELRALSEQLSDLNANIFLSPTVLEAFHGRLPIPPMEDGHNPRMTDAKLLIRNFTGELGDLEYLLSRKSEEELTHNEVKSAVEDMRKALDHLRQYCRILNRMAPGEMIQLGNREHDEIEVIGMALS